MLTGSEGLRMEIRLRSSLASFRSLSSSFSSNRLACIDSAICSKATNFHPALTTAVAAGGPSDLNSFHGRRSWKWLRWNVTTRSSGPLSASTKIKTLTVVRPCVLQCRCEILTSSLWTLRPVGHSQGLIPPQMLARQSIIWCRQIREYRYEKTW